MAVRTAAPTITQVKVTGGQNDNQIIGDGGVTNDRTPMLSGTAALTSKVTIYLNNEPIGSTTSDMQGKWNFELPESVIGGEGQKIFTATTSSLMGESEHSAPYHVEFVNVLPDAQSTITGITEDTGLAGDFVTRDQTLEFHGRIDGAFNAGDQVQITIDGYNWLNVRVDASNNTWSYNATYMMLVEGTHHIGTRVVTADGRIGTASYQDIIIDRTDPTAEAVITSIENDTGIAGDFITNDQSLKLHGEIKGLFDPQDRVQLSFDGRTWHDAVLDHTTGRWTFDNRSTIMNEGVHRVYTRVVDGAGNIGEETHTDITIDITPPAGQPHITGISDDTGSSSTDFVTHDNTLIIHGNLTGATLATGDQLQVRIDGGSWINVSVDANGNWSYDNRDQVLSDGNHLVETRVTDIAGNSTSTSSQQIVVDTQSPLATAIVDGILDDTGVSGNDFITNDQTLVFHGHVNGTLNGDERIQVRINHGQWVDATYNSANGTWTYDNTGRALPEGPHLIETRVIDLAGNIHYDSGTQTNIIVDLTPPDASATVTAISEDTGISANDFVTSDQTLLIHGQVNGPLASDERIQIRIDNGQWVDAIYNSANGTWSYDNSSQTLSGGTHTIYSRVIDAAGNAGVEAQQNIVIDLDVSSAMPSITGITDDTGISANDFLTSDQTLSFHGQVNGTLASDERIQVRIDNGQWVDVSYDAANGTWTYDNTDKVLSEGSHTIYSRVIDNAGNIGGQSQQDIMVDITPPANVAAMIVSITDDTGTNNSDFVTTDQTLVVSARVFGQLGTDERVQISLDGGKTWQETAYNAANNTWDLDNTANKLSFGKYQFMTRIVDSADNYDPLTVHDREVTIMPDAPTSTANITHFADDYGTVRDAHLTSGSYTDDRTPTLHGNISTPLLAGERVAIYRGNDFIGYATTDANNPDKWSFTDSGLQNGNNYLYKAVVVDMVGHNGAFSDNFEVRIDMTDTGFAPNIGGGADSHSASVALGANGEWIVVSDNSIYQATGHGFDNYNQQNLGWDGSSRPHIVGLNHPGSVLGAYTLADFNRDGNLDVFTTDRTSTGKNGTMFFGNGRGGMNNASLVSTGNAKNSLGGVMAIDMDGDGYLDVVLGNNSTNDSMTFLHNKGTSGNGNYYRGQWDIYGRGTRAPTASDLATMKVGQEISGVDLDNNGTVDFVGHAYNWNESSNSLKVLLNNGISSSNGSNWSQSQTIGDVFTNDDASSPNYLNNVSLTWADYDGDGYLDLFVGQSRNGTSSTSDSMILYNNGDGTLNYNAQYIKDGVWGKTSIAVDWDGDGHMDIIELPEARYSMGQSVLHRNTGQLDSQGHVIWEQQNLGSVSTTTTADGAINLNNLTGAAGATLMDYDWDGALDLVVATAGNGSKSVLANNPNKPEDGTAMHLRIVNPDGSNTFYGNTVQLFDSHGNLVSSQIINAQSGSGQNDGTGLVHFYGLDANESYSAVLLNNTKGSSNDFGGLRNANGNWIENYNASWSGLKAGEAHDAFVLTAESGNNVNSSQYNGGIVGTGYNDTFFAQLGTHSYNGGGGWVEHNGVKTWSATGGIDIVDFQAAGNTALNINLSANGYINTGYGTVKLTNIEGVYGANGNDTFTDSKGDDIINGRGGNDMINLVNGGHDTLLYETLIDSDATGGNGHDRVNGFTVGDFDGNNSADRVDLSGLLVGYTEGDNIADYLHVEVVFGNSTLYVDRDGAGGAFDSTALVTFNSVQLDLDTLLANGQIIV